MQPIRVLAALALTVAALAMVACPTAIGAGGPILTTAVPGGEGIDSPDGQFLYTTVYGKGTTAVRVVRGSGEIDLMSFISDSEGGMFGIPQVAADGSMSGLSADGGTLVLIRSFGPVNRSNLVVLGTNKLRVINRIKLEGQFSFDAISPDGQTAYVVEYPRPFVYDQYRIRKLDLRTGRLAKEPIAGTDVGLNVGETGNREEGTMRGLALSREYSDDGRWAYTLYDGGGDVPFIHALDSVEDWALCVFMPQLEDLERKQIARSTIATGPEAGTLSVVGRENLETSELARVDTTTFAVTTPGDEVSESGTAVDVPVVLAAAASIGLLVAGFLLARRRRGA